MIKVKKLLSLLIIISLISLILGNVAFAQYYNESSAAVYPAKVSSEEERMMQRVVKGELSEEEMRSMAKSKFGKDFDEMKLKRGMLEIKERMDRKESFSYENDGYRQRYYVGPSYEGYSKDYMLFGMIFQHIGDAIDPREIKQYCADPEKIAGILISKLKEKIGDLQNLCSQAEEQEAKCQETSKKMCSQIGTPYVKDDATELEKIYSIAYSCPVNKDAIVKACKLRSNTNLEQQTKHAEESCGKIFEQEGEKFLSECERFKQNQVCVREKYIERCMGGIKKEDFEEIREKSGFMYANWQCYDEFSESRSDNNCKPSAEWQELASKSCEGHCYADKSKCGVNGFSVSGECGKAAKPVCPAYPVPQCSEGAKLLAKTDANGCAYYYCEAIQTNVCPAASLPLCVQGRTLQKKVDEKGCVSYYCEAARSCPEPITPACASGQTLQKKTDDSGCAYYYCGTVPCPEIPKPGCNPDEHLQSYYDNAGCIASYQCTKYQTACPTVQRQNCMEGQSLTTKYDEKGCVVGYECVSVTTTGTETKITGNVAAGTYDDRIGQCKNSWEQQEKSCASMTESCDKDALIERCRQQSRKNYEDYLSKTEQNCDIYSNAEIKAAEDKCLRIDRERERCSEESAKRCEHMKGAAEKCRETLTEENLRKFLIEEAKKRCKFTDIVADEGDVRKSDKVEIVLAILNTVSQSDIEKLGLFVDDLREDLKLQDTTVYKGMIKPNSFGDVKLLPFVVKAKISAVPSSETAKDVKSGIFSGQKAEEAAGKLASLRDSDVPAEYLYIIEDKASEVLDVSEKLGEIEEKEGKKGIGYRVRLFLGLAKAAEQEEIRQLDEGKAKLSKSVETLAKLIDEVPSDVAKSILKEQVENLRQQQTDIKVLIETKEKKAKGLLGLFG